MKVFLDTNILLDIYHLSGADLDELRKLASMMDKGEVELLVSQQVLDEFWRNRERVIADALKRFRESKAAAQIPNIIRAYPESDELRKGVDRVNELVRALTDRVTQDIASEALKADAVLTELFRLVTVGAVSEEIVQRAERRSALGNPPGKPDSIGDAINWEWLLQQEIAFWDEELVLLSADGDFESELSKGRPKQFLLREWRARNPACELRLMKSLGQFLKEKFPAIELTDDPEKVEAIEQLEESSSFSSTHAAVAALEGFREFTNSELLRILTACSENTQVRWILTDEDVAALLKRLLPKARSAEAKKLAIEISALTAAE